MLRAVWNGTMIAEAGRTVIVEGNHYFPPGALRRQYFTASPKWSLCFCYPHPSPLARRIKNHVAFWRGIAVEGEPETTL
ncbi:DUF427 domain-containing protein [Streptomyces sp. NPDC004647]|uniref:DUF427 domain-containing protein n=1 Tax=Streptomyces sp. NPDC004647 TaxID=3154671 RepID=UPI0033A06083